MNRVWVCVLGLAGAAVLCAEAAMGQDLSYGGQASDPCIMGYGAPGVVVAGHYNTVLAPKEVAHARISDWDGTVYGDQTVSNQSVVLYPAPRHGDHMLIAPYPDRLPNQRTHIGFVAPQGDLLRTCFVDVVAFDPARQDVAGMRVGLCGDRAGQGAITLAVGVVETLDLPQRYREISSLSKDILDVNSMVGARQIQLRGESAGVASFTWVAEGAGTDTLGGICPVVVLDRQ